MASIATITLTKADTVTTVDFDPKKREKNVVVYADDTSGISAQFPTLNFTTSLASKGRETNRVRLELAVPVVRTVDGVDTVMSIARFNSDVIMPEIMTAAERADLRSFIATAFQQSAIVNALDSLDFPW